MLFAEPKALILELNGLGWLLNWHLLPNLLMMASKLASPSKPFDFGIEWLGMAFKLACPSKPFNSGIERPN